MLRRGALVRTASTSRDPHAGREDTLAVLQGDLASKSTFLGSASSESTWYRTFVACANDLAADRADLMYTGKGLARKMSGPNTHDHRWPSCVLCYVYQDDQEDITRRP